MRKKKVHVISPEADFELFKATYTSKPSWKRIEKKITEEIKEKGSKKESKRRFKKSYKKNYAEFMKNNF